MKKQDDVKHCPFCGGRAVEVLAEGSIFLSAPFANPEGKKQECWNEVMKT